jgi:hypothetical protein
VKLVSFGYLLSTGLVVQRPEATFFCWDIPLARSHLLNLASYKKYTMLFARVEELVNVLHNPSVVSKITVSVRR